MNDQAENSTPTCPECIKLRKEIEDLRAIIFDLQQRLNRNSSNSSIPPSANPLKLNPLRKPDFQLFWILLFCGGCTE
jgi:hypothetical protein